MSEQLAALAFWLVVLIPFGVFVRQAQQVRNGSRSRTRATVLFFCFSLVPALTYSLAFTILIGIEEITEQAIIGEGFSRTLLPVVGIGVGEAGLLTVIFMISSGFLHSK